MVDHRLRDLRGRSRRNFLRFATTAGAVLALERAKVLDVIADSAGVAMADDGACSLTNKSVHVVAGNGGFAWFTLLFPQIEQATSNANGVAFHAMGQAVAATDTDKPWYFAPESPWQTLDKTKRMTGFMAGTNETHTSTPDSAASVGASQSMMAVVAAIQRATPSLLPVIGVNPIGFGMAAGAPSVATVADADGMVDLFDSSASQALLVSPSDAALFESYYKAFIGLNRAAARPTYTSSLDIGKTSANFLGKNLSSQLAPSAADLARYGVDSGTQTNLSEIAKIFATAAKAFALGLTQSVILPAMNDDPHGAFGDMNTLLATVAALGHYFDVFLADLAAVKDPGCTGLTLADTTIITVHGDTPKDSYNSNGWPDGTSSNANWLYAMGNGFLKTGWFGGVHQNGNVDGFDPSTGDTVPGQSSNTTAASAGAAVAYAVAKGDIRRVQDFYTGPALDGIVNPTAIM
jgi:hypothetical protein